MSTMRQWFNGFTARTGETPDFIVFGYEDWQNYRFEEWAIPTPGEFVPWDEVPDAVLDHEFDETFGDNESPDLCAWSPSWVLFSDNYDGFESLCWVPRHPKDHSPIRPGGG